MLQHKGIVGVLLELFCESHKWDKFPCYASVWKLGRFAHYQLLLLVIFLQEVFEMSLYLIQALILAADPLRVRVAGDRAGHCRVAGAVKQQCQR